MGTGFPGYERQLRGKTMTKEQLLLAFLEEETSKGRKPRGTMVLKSRIPILFRYMEDTEITIEELGIKEAQAFQGWLIKRKSRTGNNYAKSTILAILTAAMNFYEFLKSEDIIITNPFKEIRRIRKPKLLPATVPKEKEMHLFLTELARYDKQANLKKKITRYKVHVIAELLYSTGLRVAEAANLKPDNIDFRRGIITVKDGKGGNDRIAWLNDYAKEILALYMFRMRGLVLNKYHEKNPDLLFGLTWTTLPFKLNTVLKEVSKQTLGTELTSHDFRRALGCHLLRAGCGIRHIQSILGHEDIKSTEAYTKVDKEDLKKIFDQYHPRTVRKGENA